jgi:ribosome-associated heat shock protein Hsp15
MDESGVRLDKWLWAARIFKTRQLASDAVSGGKVHVNGARVKPARRVQVNDRIRITRDTFAIDLIVRELDERRGPASRAQQLYQETAESAAARINATEQRRLEAASAPRMTGRPDKHDRRRLRQLRGRDD